MDINVHGGDIYSYKGNVLDFSANVNPLGLPQSVKQALINAVDTYDKYPDTKCGVLKKKLSIYENVKEDMIILGNGAADIIFKMVYAIKPEKALIITPTFSEYEIALRNTNCEITYYNTNEADEFCIKEDILNKINGVQLMFLCNPNNPTGQLTSLQLIKQIANKCNEIGCILVIDECFNDFMENHEEKTFKPFLEKYSNTIILKAFTKIFAMAGLRLGYCMSSNKHLLNKINAMGQPWSVSTPAQIAGIAALEEKEYLEITVKDTKIQRDYLTDELKMLGFKVFESSTNFILFKGKNLYEFLYDKGILIRKCENFVGLNDEFFRIAVKDNKSNKYLTEALKELKEAHIG